MTPADSASATSANPADPTSVDPAEVVTFADIDDPLLWVKRSARTDIAIVDHDAAWTGQYEELAAAIRSVLGDRVLALQHIGSTSVPDLAAKPVIDIDSSSPILAARTTTVRRSPRSATTSSSANPDGTNTERSGTKTPTAPNETR